MSQRNQRGPSKRGGGAPHRCRVPVRDGEETQGSEGSRFAICNILEGPRSLQTPAQLRPHPLCHRRWLWGMLGYLHLVSGLCCPRAPGIHGGPALCGEIPCLRMAQRAPRSADWLSSPTAAPVMIYGGSAHWVQGGELEHGPSLSLPLLGLTLQTPVSSYVGTGAWEAGGKRTVGYRGCPGEWGVRSVKGAGWSRTVKEGRQPRCRGHVWVRPGGGTDSGHRNKVVRCRMQHGLGSCSWDTCRPERGCTG